MKLSEAKTIINSYGEVLGFASKHSNYFFKESLLPYKKREIEEAIRTFLSYYLLSDDENAWSQINPCISGYTLLCQFVDDDIATLCENYLSKKLESKIGKEESKILADNFEFIAKEHENLLLKIYEFINQFEKGKDLVDKIKKTLVN